MDWRAREELHAPGVVKFKNYEQVYILLVNPGNYTIEYKRENIIPDTPWRTRFNVFIPIIGSATVYVLYFIVFEGKRTL
jgi:hypothetical protein